MIFFVSGLAVAGVFFVSIYNKLIRFRNEVKNAFSQIDVQLKRRYDLIPNLVEIAKGYMAHEKDTLQNVIAARNQAFGAFQKLETNAASGAAMKQLMQSENQLQGAMGKFMLSVEAYPDLKADQNMRTLMEELASTENRVGFARQAFNDAVLNYNTAREVFPNNIIATMGNFQAAESFEIAEGSERNAPVVKF